MIKPASTVLAAFLITLHAVGAQAFEADFIQGISAPSADLTLSFVAPGRIAEVLVKAGDQVSAGQLLACLDDEAERLQVQQFKIQASDRTRIKMAKAELAQKKVDLKKLKQAKTKGAASDWEVEHLNLSVRIAELSLEEAILERKQYQRRYAQAAQQLERMRLVAPIAGRVEKVAAESGEAVKTFGPVIEIVKTDPLWIDVPVPLSQTKHLALDQNVTVIFPGTEGVEAPDGKITHIAAVADAASDTLKVRIEVANSHNRPAGERVNVKFGFPSNDNVARLGQQ